MQFEICRIPGDGSCLFRALAQGVHQLETGEAPELLLVVLSWLMFPEFCFTITRRCRGWGDIGVLGIRPGYAT